MIVAGGSVKVAAILFFNKDRVEKKTLPRNNQGRLWMGTRVINTGSGSEQSKVGRIPILNQRRTQLLYPPSVEFLMLEKDGVVWGPAVTTPTCTGEEAP